MAAGVVHDWIAIRADYIEGIEVDGNLTWPTQQQVAQRHGIRYDTVRRRAADERWLDERSAYQRFLEAQRREDRVRELSEIAVAFDRENIDVARVGLRLAGGRMHELGVASLPLAQRSDEDRARYPQLPDAPESVDARELAALARAAFTFQSEGRRALGMVDGASRVEVTGDGGGPVRVDVMAELLKDNPDRLTGFLTTAARAGLLDRFDPDAEVIDVDGGDGPASLEQPLPADDVGGEG